VSIVGRYYLERGQPVIVLVQWAGRGPRNVLIRRADGTEVVRPFRGLRKTPAPRTPVTLASS
jgi:acetyl esterase